MKYSVGLQDPFGFNLKFWITFILILVGIAALLYALSVYINKHKKIKKKTFLTGKRLEWLKNKYLKRIDRIEQDYLLGRINMRTAYQRMSHDVRKFTTRATGKKISSLVYAEIAELHHTRLTELIGKYYAPEFALRANPDIERAFRDTKELIRLWY